MTKMVLIYRLNAVKAVARWGDAAAAIAAVDVRMIDGVAWIHVRQTRRAQLRLRVHHMWIKYEVKRELKTHDANYYYIYFIP